MATGREKKMHIVLLGKIGTGKSATGNTLSGKPHFDEANNFMSETISFSRHSVENVEGYTFVIYDTQGVMDALDKEGNADELIANVQSMMDNVAKLVKLCKGVSVFLLVYNVNDRFKQEDKAQVELLEQTFGPELWNHCIIVVTRIDMLKPDPAKWLLIQESGFKELMEKCKNRVVMITNDSYHKDNQNSKRDLITEIVHLKGLLGTTVYNMEVFNQSEINRQSYLLKIELNKTDLKNNYNKRIEEFRKRTKTIKTNYDRERLLQEMAVFQNTILEKDKGTKMLLEFSEKIEIFKSSLLKDGNCIIS